MATWIGLKAGGTYDWNTAGNWSGGVPNSTTAVADFRADWTAFSTVNISTSVTTNQIFYEDTVSPYNGLGISVTAGRTLTLAGTTPYIDVGSNTGGLYVTAVIAGTTRWEKRNNGILILNAVNTFSGGVNVTGGQLLVANNSALGTGSVSLVTGTKLSSNSTTGYTLANALTLNGTMTLGDATNTGALTFSGTTTIAGSTTLSVPSTTTFSGTLAGTAALSVSSISGVNGLVLSGTANTYSGAFSLTSGAVRLAAFSGQCNQLSSASSVTTSAGTTVWYTGNVDTSISVPYSGSGELVVWRDGTLTFAGSSLGSYTGIVTMYREGGSGTASTVLFSTNTAFPASGGFKFLGYTTVSSAFTLKYTGTGNVSNNGNCTLNGDTTGSAVTIDNSSAGNSNLTLSGNIANVTGTVKTLTLTLAGSSTGTTTLSGNITDSATSTTNLSKTSSGSLTLSGATSTYKGTVSVSAGTLNANSATALGADTSSGSVTSGATLSLGAALNYSTRNFTISGTGVSTGGALVHAFAGTAKIGAVTLGAATYVRGTVSGTSTLSSSIANGGFALTAGAASGNTLTLTGGISGTGGLVVGNSASDTGTVALTTTNTYQGNTTLTYGTLSLGNASALGSVGALVFNGGTLDASTPLTVANALTVSNNITFTGTAALTLSSAMALGASRTITTNGSGGALTLSGVVSGATFKLTKAGTNTLVLTNTNTYSGGTDINAGTLIFSNGSLGSSGTITINGGTNSELRWAAGNTQGGSFSGRLSVPDGALNVGSNNVILSLPFSSSTAIRFRGTLAVGTGYGGWATLFASNNTFTGDVYVESGALAATKDGSLGGNRGGGSFLRVESGACLLIAGITTATDLNFFRVSLNGAGTISDYQETSSALYLATDYPLALGNISLVTSSTIAGEMTADLTSNIDTFNSSFVLTLRAIASKTARLSGIISGPGSVVINGGANTGTVRLSGASTYAGNTTVSTGTVQAGNTQALGTTGTVTLGASGTLQTLTVGGQNGKLTVAGLTNSAGGTIRIGG